MNDKLKNLISLAISLATSLADWDFFGFKNEKGFKWWIGTRQNYTEAPILYVKTDKHGIWDYRPAEVLFNHDFARALWGKAWRKHLKEMVVSPDPISYATGAYAKLQERKDRNGKEEKDQKEKD